ncbi:GerW family sporulation protein [Pontibacter sp. H249]|uniref:GerW family sporulation protein n=1 Tax=Pontibacter sp. H249 TaxID=3133420 RepID=UPI0030C1C1AF
MEQKENKGNQPSKTTLVENLAEKLGITAKAASIYGDPIERDGVTVVPVAKAMYGFGGGAGTKAGENGSGGGGGVSLTPVGYIEIKDGNTRFRSIRDPQTTVKIVAISSLFAYLTAKTVTNIFSYKGKKKGKNKKK